ncbi:signal peptidase protein I [Candidatus Magnetomorum sp. HK-1]|nr:signal peptidase protein I [Candidatus Magnetomorum sp. HK-1]
MKKKAVIETPVKSDIAISASKKEKPEKGKLRENVEAIVIAIILALLIRTFIVQAFKIPSGSMIPTLLVGDHILVSKFIYGVKIPFLNITIIPGADPKYNDIVVFEYPKDPQKDYIKRVVGLGGDIVEIKNKKVYINQKLVDDPHAYFTNEKASPLISRPRDNYGPVKVPENSIFVMGDNRDHSYDSRFWGFVETDALKGKAFIVYFSWDTSTFDWTFSEFFNIKVRWSRLGHLLK